MMMKKYILRLPSRIFLCQYLIVIGRHYFSVSITSSTSKTIHSMSTCFIACLPREREARDRALPCTGPVSGVISSSSSRSSDGNSSLLDEGGSASQVPQASVQLAGYGSVVWPDSLSEWLVDGTGLQ